MRQKPRQERLQMTNPNTTNKLSESWAADNRWSGVQRAYTAEDVVRLTGSIRINTH
jgi:isocitrate lyase